MVCQIKGCRIIQPFSCIQFHSRTAQASGWLKRKKNPASSPSQSCRSAPCERGLAFPPIQRHPPSRWGRPWIPTLQVKEAGQGKPRLPMGRLQRLPWIDILGGLPEKPPMLILLTGLLLPRGAFLAGSQFPARTQTPDGPPVLPDRARLGRLHLPRELTHSGPTGPQGVPSSLLSGTPPRPTHSFSELLPVEFR